MYKKKMDSILFVKASSKTFDRDVRKNMPELTEEEAQKIIAEELSGARKPQI